MYVCLYTQSRHFAFTFTRTNLLAKQSFQETLKRAFQDANISRVHPSETRRFAKEDKTVRLRTNWFLSCITHKGAIILFCFININKHVNKKNQNLSRIGKP